MKKNTLKKSKEGQGLCGITPGWNYKQKMK
jgi:hypothetical protein